MIRRRHFLAGAAGAALAGPAVPAVPLHDLAEVAAERLEPSAFRDRAVHGPGKIGEQIGLERAGDHEGPVMRLARDIIPARGRNEIAQPQPVGRDLFGKGPAKEDAHRAGIDRITGHGQSSFMSDTGGILLGFMQAMAWGSLAPTVVPDFDSLLDRLAPGDAISARDAVRWPAAERLALLLLLKAWLIMDELQRAAGSPLPYPPGLLAGSSSTRLGSPCVAYIVARSIDLKSLARRLHERR